MVDPILGIVGGMSPESTADYYRAIIDTWRRRAGTSSYPRLLVNSLEGMGVFALAHAGRWDAVGEAVAEGVGRLAAAGAGAVLIASNAAHLALEHLTAPPALPIIHIADATRAVALAAHHGRLGLIGTAYIMEASFYPDRLATAGIEIVTPAAEARAYIQDKYYSELVAGVFLDSTRQRLEAIVASMHERDGIDGVILGGTELTLILTEPTCAGIPVLNTAQIHVEAGVDWLLDA